MILREDQERTPASVGIVECRYREYGSPVITEDPPPAPHLPRLACRVNAAFISIYSLET